MIDKDHLKFLEGHNENIIKIFTEFLSDFPKDQISDTYRTKEEAILYAICQREVDIKNHLNDYNEAQGLIREFHIEQERIAEDKEPMAQTKCESSEFHSFFSKYNAITNILTNSCRYTKLPLDEDVNSGIHYECAGITIKEQHFGLGSTYRIFYNDLEVAFCATGGSFRYLKKSFDNMDDLLEDMQMIDFT